MFFEEGKVFTFSWKIINFSFCSFKNGEKLTSPEFSIEALNETKWSLALYPKGVNKLCEDSVSCFLCKKDDGEKNILVTYKLEAIGPNGQILQSIERINVQVSKDSLNAGSFNFLDRKQLLNQEINENDILTIRFILIKHGFQEQIMKCAARTEIKMENLSFSWQIQIPNIPDCSKKIFLYHESTQFDVMLTTSIDKILVIVQKSAGPIRFCRFRISVFDDNGDQIKLENETHIFKPENNFSEYSTAINTAEVLVEAWNSSSFLSFLIKCDISFPVGSVLSTIERYDFENLLDGTFLAKVRPTFLDNLRDMFFKEKHCDVKLRAGDKIMSAHKSILSVRSPVFSAMLFDQDMAENRTGIVDILEVESGVLQSFLEFLYTDTFEYNDFEHVLKLILVANRYQVQSLKERCSPILMSKLSVKNVAEVFYVADLINHKKLKMFALEYIKANKNKIIPSRHWSEWVDKNTKLAIQILSKISIN